MAKAGRKRNSLHAARGAQAERPIDRNVEELQAGATEWIKSKDFTNFIIALDSMDAEARELEIAQYEGTEGPQEAVAILIKQYVAAAHLQRRIAYIGDILTNEKHAIADRLAVAVAKDRDLPMYATVFFRGLQAEGIVSTDIQSPPRGLLRAVAETIKEYRAGVRVAKAKLDPRYADAPVASWQKMDREIVGFKLDDVAPDDIDFDVVPLPPSTDIATYTENGQRIAFGRDRREMVKTWSKVIMAWANRADVQLAPFNAEVWALLLAHRMPNDRSDMKRYAKVQIASPWKKDAVVQLTALPAPAVDDDDLPEWYDPPPPSAKYEI